MSKSAHYTHDCQGCRYLGRVEYEDPWSGAWIDCDLYHCTASTPKMGGTVLARYGHECHEYASAPLAIAETYEAPFSTHGRALYIAVLAVISQKRQRISPCEDLA